MSHLSDRVDYNSIVATFDHPILHNLIDVDVIPQELVYVQQQDLPAEYQSLLKISEATDADLAQQPLIQNVQSGMC